MKHAWKKKTEVGNKTAEIPWVSCYLLQSSCSLLIIISVAATEKKNTYISWKKTNTEIFLSSLTPWDGEIISFKFFLSRLICYMAFKIFLLLTELHNSERICLRATRKLTDLVNHILYDHLQRHLSSQTRSDYMQTQWLRALVPNSIFLMKK